MRRLIPTTALRFANGYLRPGATKSPGARCDAFVIQSNNGRINDESWEQLIMVDARSVPRRKRITVILTFYGYARQDKKHLGRETISPSMADLVHCRGC